MEDDIDVQVKELFNQFLAHIAGLSVEEKLAKAHEMLRALDSARIIEFNNNGTKDVTDKEDNRS